MALEGVAGGERTLRFAALFDRRKEEPYDEYEGSLSGAKMAGFDLGRSDFLPSKITQAVLNTAVTIKIPGRKFDSRVKCDFGHISLSYGTGPRNTVERLVKEVLQSVDRFTVDLHLWTKGEGFDLALATDLDDQITKKVEGVIGAELARVQNKLRAKVNEKIAEKRQEFDQLYKVRKEDAERQLKMYQAVIDEKVAMVESKKKELAEKLEKENKGKIQDALKGLFKK